MLTFYTSIEIIFTVGYRTEKDLSDTNGYQGPRGFRQRAALTEDGKVAVFLSPIFLPIFLQPKCLPPLMEIRLQFSLNTSAFALRSADPDNEYKFHIKTFHLYVQRIKVNASLANNIEQRLAKEAAVFPLRNCQTRFFTINANVKTYEAEIYGAGERKARERERERERERDF